MTELNWQKNKTYNSKFYQGINLKLSKKCFFSYW